MIHATFLCGKEEEKLSENKISINRIKTDINIVEYAISRGYSVVKEGREIYSLKEHDSCKIYPTNTFYRFSTGAGGSIIDFVKEFEGLSTKEAINKLSEYYVENGLTPINSNVKIEKKKSITELVLPQRDVNDKAVIAYLTKTRKIDYDIVKEYLKKGIIYQDKQKNLVFVGVLEDKKLFSAKRSIYADFKMEIPGSFDEVGVYCEGTNKNTLIINESVIDQMSYRETYDFHGENCYLSVNGIQKSINCLNFHILKRNLDRQIKKIIIGFDNDIRGKEAATKLRDWVNENYPDIMVEIKLPANKDFNDDLVNRKSIDYYNLIDKSVDNLEFNFFDISLEKIVNEPFSDEISYYENDLEI